VGGTSDGFAQNLAKIGENEKEMVSKK